MAKRKILTHKEQLIDKNNKSISIVLILEGEETEKDYFSNYILKFKDAKNVVVCPGNRRTAVGQLYNRAIEKQQIYTNAAVFMVFDEDDKFSKETDKQALENYMSKCNNFGCINNNKINMIFSNRQFELWGVLHFEKICGDITKAVLLEKTKKYFPKYDEAKHKILDFDLINSEESNARRNAKMLRKENGYKRRSTTNVDELLEYMCKKLEKRPI
ncbi:MAG: RloB family protein [Muribaculaceae bacterium]|nr:RloB family protein [Muribaculaceae bacterium]